MKRIRLFIIVLFSLVSLGFMEISATWQELQGSPNGSDITAIALSAENPARLYIGTKQALYATSNREDYQTLFHLPLSAGQVNFIYDSGKFINTVYAATEDGLYKGMRDGSNWVKMFSSSDENSRRCLSFTIAEGTLYLGTLNGLFYQKANSLYWEKIPSELSNRPIFYLSQDDKYVYAATDNELFRLDRQLQKIEKIFTARISKEATSAEDEGFIIIPHSINYLTVSDSLIVIATTEGIFVSNNSGDTWTTVPQNSIPLDVVTSLLPLTKFDTVRNFSILMGTQRGAYLLRDGRGTPLYKGMETSDIRYLVKDEGNTVYAATDKGVFSLPLEALLPGNYGRRNITTSVAAVSTKPVGNQDIKVLNDYVSLERQFDNEPNINEVHQWAIDYAEVSPDKIKDWRNLAGKKAIFPNVSVGVNRSGTELFHWDTGKNPDELIRGRDYVDWDISLSWDMSELIWNNDQTSIDSRSKMMVELRDDILNQVTNLYFERRRLQMEILSNGPVADTQVLIEKQMRLAELTALIDSLTGGKFSRSLQQRDVKTNSL